MAISNLTKPKAAAAAIIGVCIAVSLFDQSFFLSSDEQGPLLAEFLQRQLSVKIDEESSDSIYSWAKDFIHPLFRTPKPSKDTVVFWHIPKSGGTNAKRLYRDCMRKKVDIEADVKKLKKADTDSIPLGAVDILFTPYPDIVIKNLVDSSNKVRALALFRHPVERLISKFYYLKTATWERQYSPEWEDMDLHDWAEKENLEINAIVKRLAGKSQRHEATDMDLELAKETIRKRFVVGLTDEMEESISRFNTVMGISEEKRCKECMNTYFGENEKKENSNPHPTVEQDDPGWQLLAEQNSYDLQLYEFILELFAEQKDLIGLYVSLMSTK
eukprot:CAMPEP_0183718546 /NCGR_PEP_ID=MMETSP0737-20130205/11772_1 /TAXON_ID=385413 /ORGANISM="Thalassiosira miniscula, Strain CCMP1093" /LENGTH=328 /DNA_ID=CAMNT_0025948123 /DNA_START=34 /DNA_END=1020 /DNA_ORIENTATION=+